MNQSEFEASTCAGAKRAGKLVEQVHGWFWFCFSLVQKSGANFANQSQSVVTQNQSKREIIFDTQLTTASCVVVCVVIGRVYSDVYPFFVGLNRVRLD